MSFNRSMHLFPNLLPAVNEPEHLMRCIVALNALFIYKAGALRENLAQEIIITDAWVQDLEDLDSEERHNMEDAIEVGDEEVGLDCD